MRSKDSRFKIILSSIKCRCRASCTTSKHDEIYAIQTVNECPADRRKRQVMLLEHDVRGEGIEVGRIAKGISLRCRVD